MMLSIKVLGPGCANCERVERHALEALEQVSKAHPDAEYEFEKVSDVTRFLEYGLLTTPGLVVNGRLVSSGVIPAPSQIVVWLEAALAS